MVLASQHCSKPLPDLLIMTAMLWCMENIAIT
jgi:hypothetical protein